MIYPSLEELKQQNHCNRYELAIAAAKCARQITDEYVNQRANAEKMLANKETDKSLSSLIKKEYSDEKAVKTAIKRIYAGEYKIIEDPEDLADKAEEAKEEAEAEAEAEAEKERAEKA